MENKYLKAIQVSSDNNVFNDHRHAIVASSEPFRFAGIIYDEILIHDNQIISRLVLLI